MGKSGELTLNKWKEIEKKDWEKYKMKRKFKQYLYILFQ